MLVLIREKDEDLYITIKGFEILEVLNDGKKV